MTTIKPPDGFISTKEFALKYNLDIHRIIRLCCLGQLEHVRMGRFYFVLDETPAISGPPEGYTEIKLFAKERSITRVSIYQMVKDGRLPCVRHNGQYFIPSDIELELVEKKNRSGKLCPIWQLKAV